MPPIWTVFAVVLTVAGFFYVVDQWVRPQTERTDKIGLTFVVLFLIALYWTLALHTLPQ